VIVHTLRALKDNFSYVLNDGASSCAVVDPGEAAPVLDFLRRHSWRLSHILCTHHHPDHVQGVPELLQHFPAAEVWTSAYDFQRIAGATRAVQEAQTLTLFEQPLKALEVPGHTLGQVAYWLPNLQALFPGDTLFSCGCGRLFEGSPAQMFASMNKLRQLPADTQIYFGHEYTVRNVQFVLKEGGPNAKLAQYLEQCEHKLSAGQDTTPSLLGTELQFNPFLKAKNVAEFADWRERRNHW
jgi:hydroxyacylglutathione hydrolase